MNVTPRPPAVLPTPRAEISTSAPRGEKPNTQAESFEQTLSRSQRKERSREHTPVDDLAQAKLQRKPDERPPAENGVSEESKDVEVSDVSPDTSAAEPLAAEVVGEVHAPVETDAPADPQSSGEPGEVSETPAELVDAAAKAVANAAVVASVMPVITATIEAASTVGAPAASVQPVKQAQVAAPMAGEPVPETGVLTSTGANPSTADAAAVTPVAASDTAADVSSDAAKRTPAATEPSLRPAARSGPAAAAETNVAAAAQPSTPAAITGKDAIPAPFAQLPTGDDAALRDDVNLGRVVRGMTSAVNQRGGSVTLRLTPPELGAVKIEMTVRDNVVSAKFTAASESVRHLLTDQMAQLKTALDRQGLAVERIEVQSLPPQPSGGGPDRQMDDAGRDGRSAGEYTRQGGERGREERSRQDGMDPQDSFERALAGAA